MLSPSTTPTTKTTLLTPSPLSIPLMFSLAPSYSIISSDEPLFRQPHREPPPPSTKEHGATQPPRPSGSPRRSQHELVSQEPARFGSACMVATEGHLGIRQPSRCEGRGQHLYKRKGEMVEKMRW